MWSEPLQWFEPTSWYESAAWHGASESNLGASSQEQQQQQIQDMAMQAGSKVAGNIPPQSLGAALQEAQNITEGN